MLHTFYVYPSEDARLAQEAIVHLGETGQNWAKISK